MFAYVEGKGFEEVCRGGWCIPPGGAGLGGGCLLHLREKMLLFAIISTLCAPFVLTRTFSLSLPHVTECECVCEPRKGCCEAGGRSARRRAGNDSNDCVCEEHGRVGERSRISFAAVLLFFAIRLCCLVLRPARSRASEKATADDDDDDDLGADGGHHHVTGTVCIRRLVCSGWRSDFRINRTVHLDLGEACSDKSL